jgi:hypothetical protein
MTDIIKCSRCFSKELRHDDFCINKNGERFKTCNKCRDYDKERKDNNREAIREQAKEHYQVVKESKTEQVKQWKRDNYDKLHEIQHCQCGGNYERRNKCRHVRTHKHIRYLEGHISSETQLD